MPTGYTADVMNGKVSSFSQFALTCARAFGALITMREDPMDAPIPDDFAPSTYSAERLAEAQAKMTMLQSLTQSQLQAACAADYAERKASQERYRAKEAEENARLDDMLAEVEKWTPPSANHAEMKDFMRQQLQISRNDLTYRDTSIIKMNPAEWLEKELKEAERQVGYHAAEQAKEVERAKSRTLWVKQLRQSLSA